MLLIDDGDESLNSYISHHRSSIKTNHPGDHHRSKSSHYKAEIDVVYTWVNGSDPRLQKSLRKISNDFLLRDSRKSLCLDHDPRVRCNSSTQCLLMPIILIRPPLLNAKRYLSNVIRMESRKNFSLVFFRHNRFGSIRAKTIFDLNIENFFLFQIKFIKN